ncbi:aminotransferase class I/II-fold pyridoxal phosphate-dependent enzyme [Gynuella sunshinyii]|uniref:7-keto-8-aminopelargonate synthetase-related enzyme n=1 Tax=Gynuella sunshinyii YC6258 TaxID=1445510 RepID=A0A0C5VJS2_9GAMM|nr:aminotransferase class I/II-fold pyridoxal phosphate-dependent enzyme [Gynuella sunshinyii]AJQ93633.1 7-keto-8-aminopelargonate synthetase-related enzyme [Gynuella sunshinyii YC6258]
MAVQQTIDQTDQILTLTDNNLSPENSFRDNPLSSQINSPVQFNRSTYLGLDHDPRILHAMTHLQSNALLREVCEPGSLFGRLFDRPCLLLPTVSLVHIYALPGLACTGDLVVLDHHVNDGIRSASQILNGRGLQVEMIRHHDLEQLEQLIKHHRQSKGRIWYCVDGICPLYGNPAPVDALYQLMDRYPDLYVYADDSYGLSWCGAQGKGSIRGKYPHHRQLILTASLSKGFGCAGGLLVLPDDTIGRDIQLQDDAAVSSISVLAPVVAAISKSVELHLSTELDSLRIALKERVDYCLKLMKTYQLPDLSYPDTPIFHVVTGEINAATELQTQLRDAGFIVDICGYPKVPHGCSGIRFELTNHHSFDDIDSLLHTINQYYPGALAYGKTDSRTIASTCKLPAPSQEHFLAQSECLLRTPLQLQIHTSIDDVINDWERQTSFKGYIGVKNLQLMEQIFAVHNTEHVDHNHWLFKYITIRDEHGDIVLMTLLTVADIKTDMFLQPELSALADRRRYQYPDQFISRAILLGTPMNEGMHLYVNQKHTYHQQALDQFLALAKNLQHKYQADLLILKAFSTDSQLAENIAENGFMTVALPDDHYLDNTLEFGSDAFLRNLKKDYRRHWKNKVLPFINHYTVHDIQTIDEQTLDHFYHMYLNHQQGAAEIATFSLPRELLSESVNQGYWHCQELKYDGISVACMFFFIDKEELFFMVLGTDSNYKKHGVYRACLYYAGLFAQQQGLKRINYGLTASLEKRRIGATARSLVALLRIADNYNIEALQYLSLGR